MDETNISISNKFTSNLKSLFHKHRIVLLEWYLVAATCYMAMVSMNINMIGTAIAIGVVNTFIVAPISHALIYGNKEEEFPRQNLPKNIIKSIIVCSVMFGLYYIVNFNFFKTSIEPITFGIIYKLVDYAFLRLVKLWK